MIKAVDREKYPNVDERITHKIIHVSHRYSVPVRVLLRAILSLHHSLVHALNFSFARYYRAFLC